MEVTYRGQVVGTPTCLVARSTTPARAVMGCTACKRLFGKMAEGGGAVAVVGPCWGGSVQSWLDARMWRDVGKKLIRRVTCMWMEMLAAISGCRIRGGGGGLLVNGGLPGRFRGWLLAGGPRPAPGLVSAS